MDTNPSAADLIFDRIDELAQLSENPNHLTRRSLTPEHQSANALVGHWMQNIGMQVHTDAIGNIIGRLEGSDNDPNQAAMLIGSHLDTVRNAGRYDGMLGVVLPIMCLEHLQSHGETLPYPVEIVGFCDEEGVRFPSTLLGSHAIAGTLKESVLQELDADKISMQEALNAFGVTAPIDSATRQPGDFLGFVECHIEQGPVLEREDLPVGLVTAISGASRFNIKVIGKAGHAGTVPMGLRKDALAGACECIVEIEKLCTSLHDLVGTVGQIKAKPGAENVIPGEVSFSLDLRSSDDNHRAYATAQIEEALVKIAKRRQLQITVQNTYSAKGVRCDSWLSGQLGNAVKSAGYRLHSLPSGAGHDAMALASLTRVAMLFVRCRDGLSHHPDESITKEDALAALNVMITFLRQFELDS